MARSVFGWCWLLAAVAGSLPGATTITGPVAGYVVEASGPSLRAILGVPGSLRYSDTLTVPQEVTAIHLAPGQAFGLVERGDSGVAILPLIGGGAGPLVAVEGAMAAPETVTFSLAAGSAILLSSSSHRLQILSGLPDNPRVIVDLDTATLPVEPHIAAVSDDGQTLLIASARAVYRVRPDGAAPLWVEGHLPVEGQLPVEAREIVSVAIFPNGTDAAVADRATGSIHLLRNILAAPVESVLATGLRGLGKVRPSWDGGTLFVTMPGTRTVAWIDVASGEIQSLDPAAAVTAILAAPVTLDPLRNRDTFLISGKPHQPGWIFYRDGNSARVVFVPAANQAAESQQ